eukprot:284667-Amphidinium_carterae.1
MEVVFICNLTCVSNWAQGLQRVKLLPNIYCNRSCLVDTFAKTTGGDKSLSCLLCTGECTAQPITLASEFDKDTTASST